MKGNRYLLRLLLLDLLLAATFTSCRKDDNPEYEYFVDNRLVASYTTAFISNILNSAADYFPELEDLQNYISDGVNVYKTVYNTQVNGESILASGLVSIPATPGEYPILSFQNGTNTINSDCPSNNPLNINYQLVEFIASMGFVVIIPDYPGFGSSSTMPHPYLIADATTKSIVDMLRAVIEAGDAKFPGITTKNEYYLLGYSQGGWATMTLHKALEVNYPDEFNLAGSVCGAGPYNIYNLLLGLASATEYSMPSYLGYIINAYSSYDQFNNPVSDLMNEPYASRLPSLYTGTLSLGQINSQLTTSIPGLLKQDFISGFPDSPEYSTVRQALVRNSISPWNTHKPLFMIHGGSDTHVSVTATQTFYDAMLNEGTSASLCTKMIIPGLDHGDALIPCMTEGLKFLINLRDL
jgi:pimeloyl-ACP methyl ester carboxylesterase